MSMEFYAFIVVLTSLLHSSNALHCESCDKSACRKPVDCKAGLVKDICGCCDVCAKAEGERCGGMWFMEGKCGLALKCVPMSWTKENKYLPAHFLEGICKTDPCEFKKCGYRKRCRINKRGKAKCSCPRDCGKSRRPVCGLLNGKQYRNKCKLNREECLTQKEIGMVPGRCKKCVFQEQSFKFGMSRPEVAPCETCTCHHGSWKCKMKPNCENVTDDAQTCLMSENGENVVLPCRKGYICRIASSPDNMALGEIRIGICKKKKVVKPRKKIFTLLEIHHNNISTLKSTQTEDTKKVGIPGTESFENTDVGEPRKVLTRNPQTTTRPLLPEGMCHDMKMRKSFRDGEQWNRDTCTTCSCTNGIELCFATACEPCAAPVFIEGKCCPVCEESKIVLPIHLTPSPEYDAKCQDESSGRFYYQGEGWMVDTCTSCFCGDNGQSTCHKPTCPTLTCKDTVYLQGRCCPVCSDKYACSYNNHEYSKGDYVLLGDLCTLCECNGKEWNCTNTLCNGRDQVDDDAKQMTEINKNTSVSGVKKSNLESETLDKIDFVSEDPFRMTWHNMGSKDEEDMAKKSLSEEAASETVENQQKSTAPSTHDVRMESGGARVEDPNGVADNDTVVYRTKRL